MPLLAGGYLGDASSNNILDASSNNIGESGILVRVAYGGFLLSQQAGISWQDLEDFLKRLEDAINLGKDFVESIMLQNIANGVEEIITKVDGVQATVDTTDDHVLNISDDGVNSLQDVRDDIAALEPGGGLTTEEHDHLVGLINADSEQIAGDVWGYTMSLPDMMDQDDGPMAQTILTHIATYLQAVNGYEGLPIPDRPHFRYCTKSMWASLNWLGYWTNTAATADVPILDLTLVENGDTVFSYLSREYGSYLWQDDGPASWPSGGSVWLEQTGGANAAYFRCTLTDADIQALWPAEADPPAEATNVPPVWPGVANVTLGTPVALADGLTITTPMDGVLIAITAVDQYKTWFTYHDTKAYRHVGSLAFFSDNGELEEYQLIAFEEGVYTCRYMKQAAGVKIRTAGGTVGTVTPWLISVT